MKPEDRKFLVFKVLLAGLGAFSLGDAMFFNANYDLLDQQDLSRVKSPGNKRGRRRKAPFLNADKHRLNKDERRQKKLNIESDFFRYTNTIKENLQIRYNHLKLTLKGLIIQ